MIYRVQGLNPETGIFTECKTQDYNKAIRLADSLVYGEIRNDGDNSVIYVSRETSVEV